MNDDKKPDWAELHAALKARREHNKRSSPGLLKGAGLDFDVHNGGSHIVVRTQGGQVVDFWPSTGKWIVRGQTHQRGGVRKLIGWCKGKPGMGQLTGDSAK